MYRSALVLSIYLLANYVLLQIILYGDKNFLNNLNGSILELTICFIRSAGHPDPLSTGTDQGLKFGRAIKKEIWGSGATEIFAATPFRLSENVENAPFISF